MTYRIQDREAGNEITTFSDYDRAEAEIEAYEQEDIELGYYTPNFYELIAEES